ncbi:type I restriction endonuclease subunit R, EcoR124 family [Soehngenia longivitae]|uniref:type I restriction endonuclease subunit R, EcoR124 family n=1 Tax=Soehngenia longivitae TaxID=2562294 RepID=UPI002494EC92|nr:hypothetical protein [Soehngenia longivitae]
MEAFIEQVNVSTKVNEDRRKFILELKEEDIRAIKEEKLKPKETRHLIEKAFRDGTIKTTSTAIDKIMPPMSRLSGGRAEKKQGII